MRGGGPKSARGKKEVGKEGKVNMCGWGGDKLRGFREKMKNENLRFMGAEGVGQIIE